jgi:CheY-like chemotaxis protein
VTRILYVEDNDDNIFVLHRRLSRAGFEVSIATNGEQAVRLATADKPDLIVMDLALPKLDGWEATRRLKTQVDTRAIPIIALSAHAMARHRERALQAGCDDFEEKPVDFERLLMKIKAALARSTGESGA